MFEHLKQFFSHEPWPPGGGQPDQQKIAVAALLIEAAGMRDRFGDEERQVIERILSRTYQLQSDAATRLLRAAQEADEKSAQLFPFTHQIVEGMAPEGRVEVIEMLWETVYSDGILSPDEDALIRQVASLLYVSDRDRGEARLRVIRKLGL